MSKTLTLTDTRLTDEQIKARVALCENATPGPWHHDSYNRVTDQEHALLTLHTGRECLDGRFIAAHSPDVMLAIYSELLELRTQLEVTKNHHEVDAGLARLRLVELTAARRIVEIARGVSVSLGKESVFNEALAQYDAAVEGEKV